MKILFYKYRYGVLFLAGILFLLMNSCAKVEIDIPGEHVPVEKPAEVGPEPQKIDPVISMYEILAEEAQKFALQGDFQNALFIFNQAYYQADDAQKIKLIPFIEALLAQAPSQDLERFFQIPDIAIPRSLIHYWLGWSYSLEDDSIRARQTLESFLIQYPDHRYFSEASGLLEMVIKTSFAADTIGCLLPLSGKYAIFGHQALTGIQLAVKHLSDQYGKTFKIIIEDTGADGQKAVRGVDRLYQKNVSAILGPLLPVNEAGDRAQELGIPMIALTQKEEFPDQGEYLFSNFITPRMQVQTLASYLFGELGIQKVAILYPQEKYGTKYMNLFWDMADDYGAQVVGVESYDGMGTDFSKALQKLNGQYFPLPDFLKPEEVIKENLNPRAREKEEKIQIDFQALFIPDSPSKIKLILPQLAFNDITDIYLVGTNLWHHKTLLKKDVRRYTKNAVIADGFFNQSMNPVTINFTKEFEALFSKKPRFLEAVAYDTASILFSTAMDENVNSQKDLKSVLQGGKIYEGATGITLFDSGGHAHRRLFLVTIKNNQFVEINH